ncbi:MAG: type III-B CRISPR module-associated protein Cmr3 [bacterium]|nr:type III-B CRISPR module-associated protein Cmr3 [bacterium]
MLKIKAKDVLFFRDGKSFTKTTNYSADSFFPPLPSTVYGALRTAYISQNGNLKLFEEGKMKETIGTSDNKEKGCFNIKGIYLEFDNKILFPAPFDLLVEKEEKGNKAFKMKLIDNNIISSISFSNILVPTNEKKSVFKNVSNRYIDYLSLKDYLNNKNDKIFLYDKIFLKEPKIGIQLDFQKGTTKKHYIYSYEFLRPAIKFEDKILETSIIVDENNIEFKKGFYLKLGGEQRVCFAEKLENTSFIPKLESFSIELIKKTKLFKLYLATPAIFQNGYVPFVKSDKENIYEVDKSIKLKLLTFVTPRSKIYSGWDIKKKKPKKTINLIMQGTVYYFEIIDGDVNEIIEKLHYQNISDYFKEEGFGLSFIGVVG